jgi:predicted RNase H-like HicB family nuclease
MKKKNKITLIIQKSGGWYIAYIKEIPGVNTQGRTKRSARRNLYDALALIVTVNRELESNRH